MMDNDTRRQESKGRDSRKPTGGIPDAEVRTKAKLEALQHPATMFPLSLSIISAVYLGMLSPLFGGWLLAAGVCAVSAVAAVRSYRSHYAKSLPRVNREIRDHEKEEESRSEEVELSQAQDVLRKGFLNIASEEGTMVLSDLVTEYEQLRPAIAERRPADPFSVALVPALAAETYKRGLGVLSEALELIKVIQTPGKEKLDKEIAGLEQEAGVSEDEEVQAERVKLRKERLDSLKQRREMVERYQLYVDRLFGQAQRCEAALYKTRLELAAVRAGSSGATVDAVVQALQNTIHQAKLVQDELQKLGY
ncbi:MAG: hypothetical protein HY673_13860 [Chloroflexi bacterium]|nr:hypothetical protein [Chloroflexota bacterium]